MTFVLLGAARAWAGEQGEPAPLQPIEELDLGELLELPTVSSSKVEQSAAQAPGVVTVVTQEEIRSRGYTSLADVLRVVPGLYDVYDLVTHNVGVRGVNGGARAAGGVVKVMIDGEPVDFRPTTGNFFGEELVPLEAVKRVEVIRGPASALYGANAFLGVVNIITRSGADSPGVKAVGKATVNGSRPGGGGAVVVGATAENFDLLAAASYFTRDRSGLSLPSSSPALSANPGADRGPSANDQARASSLLLRQTLDGIAGGRLSFLATLQDLDAGAEFQDFAPLTHQSRLGWTDQKYRLSYEIAPTPASSLSVAGSYFNAAPSARERLDLGRPDFVVLRRVGAQGFSLAADGRLNLGERLSLMAGVDWIQENQLLQRFDELLIEDVLSEGGTVLRPAGTIIPDEGSGDRIRFENFGALLQGVVTVLPSVSVTAGARLDAHSIYGINPSARLALVYAPPGRPLGVKLLYGSSFKAPSAVQLYSHPMAVLDIRGNPSLKAQTAQTVELAALYGLPGGRGELSVNLFVMALSGKVEFIQKGIYLEAQNLLDERVVGGELESRLVLTEGLRARLSGGVARTVDQTAGPALLGAPEVRNALFPSLQAHLILEYQLPVPGKPQVSAELSYVGPRSASQSNALIRGAAYSLPAYLSSAATLSWSGPTLFQRQTSVALRLTNALGLGWAEPGFGGFDVPGPARAATLTITQSL
ncbi:MAG: TonB-dependent receptor plug domain-containing protein [Myxococcaceae bacterium]